MQQQMQAMQRENEQLKQNVMLYQKHAMDQQSSQATFQAQQQEALQVLQKENEQLKQQNEEIARKAAQEQQAAQALRQQTTVEMSQAQFLPQEPMLRQGTQMAVDVLRDFAEGKAPHVAEMGASQVDLPKIEPPPGAQFGLEDFSRTRIKSEDVIRPPDDMLAVTENNLRGRKARRLLQVVEGLQTFFQEHSELPFDHAVKLRSILEPLRKWEAEFRKHCSTVTVHDTHSDDEKDHDESDGDGAEKIDGTYSKNKEVFKTSFSLIENLLFPPQDLNDTNASKTTSNNRSTRETEQKIPDKEVEEKFHMYYFDSTGEEPLVPTVPEGFHLRLEPVLLDVLQKTPMRLLFVELLDVLKEYFLYLGDVDQSARLRDTFMEGFIARVHEFYLADYLTPLDRTMFLQFETQILTMLHACLGADTPRGAARLVQCCSFEDMGSYFLGERLGAKLEEDEWEAKDSVRRKSPRLSFRDGTIAALQTKMDGVFPAGAFDRATRNNRIAGSSSVLNLRST